MNSENSVPAMKHLDSKPKPKWNNSKLLRLVITFFIIIFIILFFQSSLSKISEVRITGNELMLEEELLIASALNPGDHFFAFRTSRVAERVEELPFVESVEVTRDFPGVVDIHVTEYPAVALQVASDGTREVLLADGNALPLIGEAARVLLDLPILSGWLPDNELKVRLCAVLSQVPRQYLSDISEIRPDPSVAYPDKIKMYTRSQYEVYTTIEYLAENLEYLGFLTSELRERGKTSGIITMLEQIRHSSYESVESAEQQ